MNLAEAVVHHGEYDVSDPPTASQQYSRSNPPAFRPAAHGRAGHHTRMVHTPLPRRYHPRPEWPPPDRRALMRGEYGLGRVVAGDERDARAAVAAGAAEVEALDAEGLIRVARGAGAVGTHLLGMDQAVAVVAARSPEHFAHVTGCERGVLGDEVGEV